MMAAMRSLPVRLLGVALFFALASTANAQDEESVPHGEFSVMRFSPSPGPGNYFQVAGAATPGHLTGSVGLVIDYAHAPFTLWNASCSPDGTECDVGDSRAQLVEYVAAAHLTGTFTILDHLQIGVIVPLVITNGEEFTYADDDGTLIIDQPGGTAFSLADPRLELK